MPNGTFHNPYTQAIGRITRSSSTSTLDPTHQLGIKMKSLQITTVSQMPIELVSSALQIYDTKSKYYNRNRLHVKTIKRQNATISIPSYTSYFDGDEGADIVTSAPFPVFPVAESDSDSDI